MQKKKTPATKTKKANNDSVKVHNLAKLEKVNPLPISFDDQSFISLSGHNYIPFFAPDDDAFERFLIVRLLSLTQSSCIGDKTLYSAGSGLNVMDQDFPKEFDRKINNRRQTVDDILKMGFDSYWQDGNAFIEIVRTELAGNKYIHVYKHHNIDCRLENPKDGGYPTHVLRSRQFRRAGIWSGSDKAVRIPLWTDMPISESEIWAKDPDYPNVERTMIHVRNELGALDGYGLPSNYAGQDNGVLEYKSLRFNLDNFDNNMFLGGVLTILGNMAPDEEKKLFTNLRKMYTGDGTYNRILPISSSEGGVTDTKFTPFTQSHDGHFIELDKRNEDKIISANNWSKELLDMKNQSGLGKGGGYLKALFMMKYKTIIRPAQELMMFHFIEPLMQIVDEWKGTKFTTMPWYIKPLIPVSFEGELDINELLTIDEGREEIGKKPFGDDRGKKTIAENSNKKKEEAAK